ncbi:DNA-processing protein DprA [Fundidesulfovibrio agrisoli]|uniref:DNA-processing protein DprA n=1 Tax=Fundidesulfovibrio agrisoli TaxID=2922717 RepID=UPI001FADF83E|nr:DNA-processing protein DprA [Fundidesulfovibrio agrisoli]
MNADAREELWASISLKHAPGLGPRTARKLLDAYGCASEAVRRCRGWHERGLANSSQCQGFLAESWRGAAEAELRNAEEKGVPTLLWSDPRYPRRLREIPDPPVFLYCLGDTSLLDNPCVAVVGSRDCSRYGLELAQRISLDLAESGVTIVSGLALGIDRQAHMSGLSGAGSSIAVMGTGPDLIYPASNRDVWKDLASRGLILSEFPPGTKPLAANFPLRNRIISGLSLGVLVVEAHSKSGSLITARLAMEQGREVFAVPGPVSLKSYRGCHEIINKGAKLVHDAQDILLELKPQLEAHLEERKRPPGAPMTRPGPKPGQERLSLLTKEPPAAPKAKKGARTAPTPLPSPAQTPPPEPGTPFERDLQGHLAAMGATHIDALCRAFGRDAAEMSRTLVLLELKGVVRRLPGGYYLSA